MNKFFYLFFILASCIQPSALAQSAVDEVSKKLENFKTEEPFSEKIKIISPSKKIFVLTNENEKLDHGDFVSFLVDKKLAARAVVAKVQNNRSALKIVKIYSLQLWSRLKKDSSVEIVRGDDSYLYSKKTGVDDKKDEVKDPMENGEAASNQKKDKISDEDDLYSEEASIDDTIDMKERGNRAIRPDNIVGFSIGQIKAQDYLGAPQAANTMNGSWAYQFADNLWLEGTFSSAKLANFPADGVDCSFKSVSGRIKYAIEAPLYTYVFPFVGFKYNMVDYPGVDDQTSTEQQDNELNAVSRLSKSGAVGGVTLLRRLVPGWFFKVEVEKDTVLPISYNAGLSIEF